MIDNLDPWIAIPLAAVLWLLYITLEVRER